jgi:hypothetical protein
MQEFRTVGTDATTSVVQINDVDYDLYPRKASLEARFDIWYTESIIAYPSPSTTAQAPELQGRSQIHA